VLENPIPIWERQRMDRMTKEQLAVYGDQASRVKVDLLTCAMYKRLDCEQILRLARMTALIQDILWRLGEVEVPCPLQDPTQSLENLEPGVR
jgi:hypothetical protein